MDWWGWLAIAGPTGLCNTGSFTCVELYWVVLSCIGLYWVVLSCIALGSTELYWVEYPEQGKGFSSGGRIWGSMTTPAKLPHR